MKKEPSSFQYKQTFSDCVNRCMSWEANFGACKQRTYTTLFSPKIGPVYYTVGSSNTCNYYEGKLVRYKIN